MRSAIFFFLFICSTITTFAQQTAFTNVSLSKQNTLNFTVPKEVNVRHYRVEAGNDKDQLNVITTIPARGNSMLPTNYQYSVAAYNYTYYRVVAVEMGNGMPTSVIVSRPAKTPQHKMKEIELSPSAEITVHK